MALNLTCCATISVNGVEFLRYFSGGGTRNEVFADYFFKLIKAMKEKYPNKQLVFILDNLWAHKSSLILNII